MCIRDRNVTIQPCLEQLFGSGKLIVSGGYVTPCGVNTTPNIQSIEAQNYSITAGNGLSGGGTTGTISLAVDLNELATETSIAQADFVAMVDATDNGSGKITFSNFEDTIFSNMNSASSDVAVAAGGAITLANDCVDSAEIADGAIDTVHIADDQVTNDKLQYSSVQIGASTVALGNALTLSLIHI